MTDSNDPKSDPPSAHVQRMEKIKVLCEEAAQLPIKPIQPTTEFERLSITHLRKEFSLSNEATASISLLTTAMSAALNDAKTVREAAAVADLARAFCTFATSSGGSIVEDFAHKRADDAGMAEQVEHGTMTREYGSDCLLMAYIGSHYAEGMVECFAEVLSDVLASKKGICRDCGEAVGAPHDDDGDDDE